MKEKVTCFDAFLYVFMFLLCLFMIYPVLITFFKSISETDAILAGRVTWYPIGVNFRAYALVFKEPNLIRSYANTLFYCAVYTIMHLVLTSLAGFVLTIKEFRYRRIFATIFIIPMFFGGGLIPFYLLIKSLGMMNTFWAITLPGALGGYNIFIYRTFFQNIPESLSESAVIDGAGYGRVLWNIIVPLSKPLYATYALFSIVGMWNSWFSAMIFLTSPDLMPIQILLRRLLIDDDMTLLRTEAARQMIEGTKGSTRVVPEAIKAAATIITIVPIMVIYPFLQKYFVKGVMVGAIKG